MAMEKKMKNNNNDKVELPQELIVEILLRLPVKSLLRFKCVSKSWFSIISADRFAKSHFELSAAFKHRVLCFGDSELRSIHPDEMFHDNPATSIIKLIVPHPMNVHISIQGSCRGFLMLHQKPDLIIWNPSTGIFKRISYSHISQNLFGFRPDSLLFGFGYDASKDDYLVVIVLYNDIMGKFMECFSLKANKWEKHEITLRWNDIRYASSPGFYLNGAIHWDASSDYILAFNVIERVFFKIPLPEPLAQVFMSCCLELLGGFLSLTVWTQNNTTEIWVMKEYMVASSWISYKISERTFEPIYFTKGGEVIGLNSKGALEKYNIKGELLLHFPNCEYDYHFWMYTESLLSFPREEYDHH